MDQENFGKLGPIYAAIGAAAAAITGGNPDGIYLYVEAGDGWHGGGLFRDDGTAIRYFDTSHELGELIFEAWKSEEPAKRWSVMEYEINGSRFDAHFKFPDEVDVEAETDEDRREDALVRRYGNRQVIYPPRPGFQQN